MNRVAAQEHIAQIHAIALAQELYTHPCTLFFDTFTFTGIHIQSIQLARLSDITNKPERIMVNGVLRSPSMGCMITDQGKIYIELDDTQVIGVYKGIRFIFATVHDQPAKTVEIRREK